MGGVDSGARVKDTALRRRISKGFGGQAFAQAANLAIQAASVPLLLHAWGVGVYGEWLIVSAVPTYLALSDVGFTTAATNEMTMAVVKKDLSSALETLNSAWVFTIAISLVAVGLVLAVGLLLPIADWLRLAHLPAVGAVLMLLCIQTLGCLQTNLVYAGYHCVGEYGAGQFLAWCVRLLEFGLMAVTVLKGGSPLAAAGASLAGRTIGTLGMRMALRYRAPWIEFAYRHASWAALKRLSKPAVAFAAFPLGSALNLQGLVIVVGAVLGPTATVAFSTLRTLTRLVLQGANAIRASVQAEFSIAFAAGDYTLLRALHRRSCQVALVTSSAMACGLGVFGTAILSRWTNGHVVMNWVVFLPLLAAAVAAGLTQASVNVVYATNRHAGVGAAYVLMSGVTVLGAYWAARMLDLLGVAGVLLVSESAMAAYVLHTSLRLLHEVPTAHLGALSSETAGPDAERT